MICISHYPDRILASTDLNTVQVIFMPQHSTILQEIFNIPFPKAYTYPERNRDGTEFTFTAPVTTIKVDSKVRSLVVSTSSSIVMIVIVSS